MRVRLLEIWVHALFLPLSHTHTVVVGRMLAAGTSRKSFVFGLLFIKSAFHALHILTIDEND